MSAARVVLHSLDDYRTPRYVRVDLDHVRAANTLLIHYDLDRDGWVIEQPIPTTDGTEPLEEVAFVPAWTETAGAAVDRMNGR